MGMKIAVILRADLKEWQAANATFCLGWAMSDCGGRARRGGETVESSDGETADLGDSETALPDFIDRLPDYPIIILKAPDGGDIFQIGRQAEKAGLDTRRFPLKAFEFYNDDLRAFDRRELELETAALAVKGEARAVGKLLKKFSLLTA